jgi:hypothetical protein
MHLQRLRSNAFYFGLSAEEKAAYNAGLPVEFMGQELRQLKFASYMYGSDVHRKQITATTQMQTLIDFTNKLAPGTNISATIGLHSAPTDGAAFKAAAAMFCAAQQRKLVCLCLSTSTILHNYKSIAAADVYLIHGVNDAPNSVAIWALRDFLRDHDGSLRLVVMTSARELTLDALIHEQMRMHFNYLFCLDDNANDVIKGGQTRNA